MNTTQLTESLTILNRIKEIDHRLTTCRSVTSVTIKGHNDGFVVEYDTAKMYAAKISAELISTRANLVDNYLLLAGAVERDIEASQ